MKKEKKHFIFVTIKLIRQKEVGTYFLFTIVNFYSNINLLTYKYFAVIVADNIDR